MSIKGNFIMFDFFGSGKPVEPAKDYIVPKPESTVKENYSIGVTDDGRTSLTLKNGAYSLSMYMNRDACERMIRMIRATYIDEEVVEE
jgi:hypothetical protein